MYLSDIEGVKDGVRIKNYDICGNVYFDENVWRYADSGGIASGIVAKYALSDKWELVEEDRGIKEIDRQSLMSLDFFEAIDDLAIKINELTRAFNKREGE